MDVKLGSALLRGFQYLIFLSAGVMTTVNGISNAEGALNASVAEAEAMQDATAKEAATVIAKSNFAMKIHELMESVTPQSLIIIGVWVVALLVGCFVTVFLLLRFGYKITEESHRQMVDELEKRHAKSGFDKEELAEEQPAQ